MKLVLAAALALVCISTVAHARPAPPDQFVGDRYGSQHAPVARQIVTAEGMIRAVRRAATGRPRAWCGWWLGHHLGMPSRHLWRARNWASVGTSAGGPRIGAIVVWRHHVGIITGRHGNQWVIKSGNDGRRVRERPRSVAGAIAFRSI